MEDLIFDCKTVKGPLKKSPCNSKTALVIVVYHTGLNNLLGRITNHFSTDFCGIFFFRYIMFKFK